MEGPEFDSASTNPWPHTSATIKQYVMVERESPVFGEYFINFSVAGQLYSRNMLYPSEEVREAFKNK